ncbi:uncharacterized protein QC763_707360 [Podospora pseudopauciseta]|uniref:Tyrosine specific protein phosphatases domain-containing protein n=1 Tax=Podospora pseudopauciseta TaxID=2093780 RepID=A0ABR0H1I2_9PEZI|nr:hypothetical protein QC763_707360 [Podospora pseudopauciseta]
MLLPKIITESAKCWHEHSLTTEPPPKIITESALTSVKGLSLKSKFFKAFAFTATSGLALWMVAMVFTEEKLDAKSTDPPLLEKYSEFKSYTTSKAFYNKLRIFYRKHPQTDNLPKDPPLPLLVFIHGLGGSVAQFHRILTSLTHLASCLAVDLPGCGRSEYTNTSWVAYTTDALVELLEMIINDYREEKQRVVLIAHSMGCGLATLLINPRHEIQSDLCDSVLGLVAMCPALMPTEEQVKKYRRLLWIPGFIFDLWRAWDRRGGINSASVSRIVGPMADAKARKLQLMFNYQSRTPVFRRMAWGMLPEFDEKGNPKGGFPENSVWTGLQVPVLIISGWLDEITPMWVAEKVYDLVKHSHTTPPWRAGRILDWRNSPISTLSLGSAGARSQGSPGSDTSLGGGGAAPAPPTSMVRDSEVASLSSSTPEESCASETPSLDSWIPPLPSHPPKYIKNFDIKVGGHGLLFSEKMVAGLISEFLTDQITKRLDLSWQLQYLNEGGKWDVKNYEKWRGVVPVSDPIAGVFRAMKTLRETDGEHSPQKFGAKYGGKTIRDVIDISHDTPVYEPNNLRVWQVSYHKVATVSKIPPSRADIDRFIEKVDEIRAKQTKFEIGVHCHYGFNRTGFLIVCYLVERLGWKVEDAIEHFAQARPNGIKHAHFRDRLHLMYPKSPKRYVD